MSTIPQRSSWPWLPFNLSMPSFALPTLTLPTSVQSRFISFVLKRTLGHLLKPGQLNVHQIDSQIGNGFVEVKELQLDSDVRALALFRLLPGIIVNPQAINVHLSDLPLRLQAGSIETVTARIPWPNPITSSIGLSGTGLRLSLVLQPCRKVPRGATAPVSNLSDSVASVAESFLKDGLSQYEEAKLQESIHPELLTSVSSLHGSSQIPPGSMDPFLASLDHDVGEREGNLDPTGVSLFASLIERLLARFELDMKEIHVTLIHPNNASFTFTISEISYGTESPDSKQVASGDRIQGERRTIRISGLSISAVDLTPPSPPPSTLSLLSSVPSGNATPIREGDGSDIDEETHMTMSQSTFSLPSRAATPPSPSSSVASATSSVYQSAVSSASRSRTPSPQPIKPGSPLHDSDQPRQYIILSSAEPLILRLTTPLLHEVRPNDVDADRTGSPNRLDKLKLSVNVGSIAVALRAERLRAVVDAIEFISIAGDGDIPESSQQSGGNMLDQMDCKIRLRGVTLLILPSIDDALGFESGLTTFFVKPLIPPRLPYSYVRVQLDAIHASLMTSPSPTSRSISASQQLTTFTISDFSVLSFKSPSTGTTILSKPIIITDPLLLSSYSGSPNHLHPRTESEKAGGLATLDVVDWTSGAQGAGIKQWRSKPHRHRWGPSTVSNRSMSGIETGAPFSGSPTRASATYTSSSPHASVAAGGPPSSSLAIDIQLCRRGGDPFEAKMQTMPLHAFLDVNSLSVLLEFIEALGPLAKVNSSPIPTDRFTSDDSMTPLFMPRASNNDKEREKERRRLEKLVLEDLGLVFDYRAPEAIEFNPDTGRDGIQGVKAQKTRTESMPQITVSIPLVRLQVRVPSPSNQQPRSGSLVLDLHAIIIRTGAANIAQRVARFEDGPPAQPSPTLAGGNHLLSVDLSRIFVASSLPGDSRAVGLLSIGPLSADPTEKHEGRQCTTPTIQTDHLLLPSIWAQSTPPHPSTGKTTMSLLIHTPSIHVNISKPYLDCLQFWADDLSQWIERTLGEESVTERGEASRDPSLIGSRFFAKRSGSGYSDYGINIRQDAAVDISGELVIKITLPAAFVHLNIPSQGHDSIHPFEITASDIDALVEIAPEGKEATVITVGISGLNVTEGFERGFRALLTSTKPQCLTAPNQPLLKLRFHSLIVPGTSAKESRVKLSLHGFICNVYPQFEWIADLTRFFKAPPGVFESVVPSDRTSVSVKILDAAVRITPPNHRSAVLVYVGELGVFTDIVGDSEEATLKLVVPALSILLTDGTGTLSDVGNKVHLLTGLESWKEAGYALLADFKEVDAEVKHNSSAAAIRVTVYKISVGIHLCADSISGIAAFELDLKSAFTDPGEERVVAIKPKNEPRAISHTQSRRGFLDTLDENAFRRAPDVGLAPDMVEDDLPTNPDYLDASFGAAAGFRELFDEDLYDFNVEEASSGRVTPTQSSTKTGITSNIGGETIRMLVPAISVLEGFYDILPPDTIDHSAEFGETKFRLRLHDCDLRVFLYDGYDWNRTRKVIEEEVKEVRKRLAKIRQLLATGQTLNPDTEETSTLLFNSVYVGLEQDIDELEPGALIAAIDNELDDDVDTSSSGYWQSVKPQTGGHPPVKSARMRSKRLHRHSGPSIEFNLLSLNAEVDQYRPGNPLVSRVLVTVKDFEILDHIKTSTWSKFLTEMRSDSHGDIRETDSNMVRVELRTLLPVQNHSDEEARLKVKLLPLRLYVDQDALDFLKQFFSFKDPHAGAPAPPENEIYFQHVEVFPVDIKLDYKPRRVDYRALRAGKTIELMNFFHFDGSEMTLRHITLKGISGWPKLGDTLNDLWTPDVKANQLADVISGVAPIRSFVNVGSGVADLVLLPIAQYKKDGRIMKGLQKGTTAFVKSTAMEAIQLGARLATGTQVILEQAEHVLGGQFKDSITAETVQATPSLGLGEDDIDNGSDTDDLISKYADQPLNIKEGVQSAYDTLSKNIKSAGQTILAVPMEVYERSVNEGPARAVVRAVPIAVLKPMIGASGAVSKTLLGLRNTLDPDGRHEHEDKYKQR